eukprot:2492585-Pyramimonas_sp.AAC.1
MAALLLFAAVLMIEEQKEFKYVTSFVMGLQNAMLTATTGFARTTHVTGTALIKSHNTHNIYIPTMISCQGGVTLRQTSPTDVR